MHVAVSCVSVVCVYACMHIYASWILISLSYSCFHNSVSIRKFPLIPLVLCPELIVDPPSNLHIYISTIQGPFQVSLVVLYFKHIKSLNTCQKLHSLEDYIQLCNHGMRNPLVFTFKNMCFVRMLAHLVSLTVRACLFLFTIPWFLSIILGSCLSCISFIQYKKAIFL